MISHRMIKMTEGGSAIRAMFEEGNRLAALYGRENVYDFSLGNPNIPAPEKIRSEILSIAGNTDPMALHGYMPNAGYPFVRKAVAESLNSRFGGAFGEDNIIMTVGAAGGLNIVLKTLLNPGDEVLTFAPYFLEYGNYVSNFDGVLKAVPAPAERGFQPDAEALFAAVTEKTKAVIINNPNNPTGVVYSEDTVRALAAALGRAQEKFGNPIYIIADEPYRELCYDGAAVPWLPGFYDNTIVCYSWSKSLSLPGERIGYVAISPKAEDAGLIFSAAVIANRILGFVNAPALQQRLVAACLEEKTDVAAYDANRRALYNGLTQAGFQCVYPSGAFYMWVKTPEEDRAFTQRAKKYNILLVPGSSFACPGYVRIAYCVSHDMIIRSLPAFRKLAEEYGLTK
ncbi:MAG: pyridoxal phosphate-dependent aminotransferase [Oscillospiraceae bacterium]|nr:pyridoxal phosphate-dependent aminotransferase [Oscillospiraceae bacterium]